ncbi:hypothetical protein FSP39_013265 [Pinctada imbricata]|uniref:Hexosyltransferase n=1 Tax=Pinctada imbricata TaxID=66713 RepID=A0AA88Y0A8_PINIB|nr:hypothetical protein FSP39_013265 [Pinctada imbricata]
MLRPNERCVQVLYRVSALIISLCFIFIFLETLAAGIVTIYISSTFNTIRISNDVRNKDYEYFDHNSGSSVLSMKKKERNVDKVIIGDEEYEIIKTEENPVKMQKKSYITQAPHEDIPTSREEFKKWAVERRWKKLKLRVAEREKLLLTIDQSRWDTWACNECFYNKFEFINPSKNVCSIHRGMKGIKLLFVITTQPQNFNNRLTLRNTWLTLAKNNTGEIRYIFLLGNVSNALDFDGIRKENLIYNDIVIGNFTDNYTTLTIKTLAGMSWTVENCRSSKYVMKTDDDMWINTKRLLPMLSNFSKSFFVGGACLPDVKPIRTLTGTLRKFYVPYVDFQYKKYPPYCQGLGILVSSDVAEKVLHVSRDTPFFIFEDVYLGLCFARLRVRPINIPGFQDNSFEQYSKYYNLTISDMIGEKFITIHQAPNDVMVEAWNKTCK